MRIWHVYTFIFALLSSVGTAHADGPWQGVWDHVGNYDDLHLRQDGRRVWGDYLTNGPVEGRVSPDGTSIRMTWVYDANGRDGLMVFRMTEPGAFAIGDFSENSIFYEDGITERWNVSKASDTPAPFTYSSGSGPFWPPNLNPDSEDNQDLRDWLNFTDLGETEDIVANPGGSGAGNTDNPFGTPDLFGSRPDGPITAGPVTRAIYNRGGTEELGRIVFARYGARLRGEGQFDTDLAIGGPKAGGFDLFIDTDPRETSGNTEEVTFARRSGNPSIVTGTIPKRAFTSDAETILGTVTFTSAANPPMELEFRKIFDPASSAFGARTFMVVDLDPGEALAVWANPFNTGSFVGALPHDQKGISILLCVGDTGVAYNLEDLRGLGRAELFVRLRGASCRIHSGGLIGWASAQHLMRE